MSFVDYEIVVPPSAGEVVFRGITTLRVNFNLPFEYEYNTMRIFNLSTGVEIPSNNFVLIPKYKGNQIDRILDISNIDVEILDGAVIADDIRLVREAKVKIDNPYLQVQHFERHKGNKDITRITNDLQDIRNNLKYTIQFPKTISPNGAIDDEPNTDFKKELLDAESKDIRTNRLLRFDPSGTQIKLVPTIETDIVMHYTAEGKYILPNYPISQEGANSIFDKEIWEQRSDINEADIRIKELEKIAIDHEGRIVYLEGNWQDIKELEERIDEHDNILENHEERIIEAEARIENHEERITINEEHIGNWNEIRHENIDNLIQLHNKEDDLLEYNLTGLVSDMDFTYVGNIITISSVSIFFKSLKYKDKFIIDFPEQTINISSFSVANPNNFFANSYFLFYIFNNTNIPIIELREKRSANNDNECCLLRVILKKYGTSLALSSIYSPISYSPFLSFSTKIERRETSRHLGSLNESYTIPNVLATVMSRSTIAEEGINFKNKNEPNLLRLEKKDLPQFYFISPINNISDIGLTVSAVIDNKRFYNKLSGQLENITNPENAVLMPIYKLSTGAGTMFIQYGEVIFVNLQSAINAWGNGSYVFNEQFVTPLLNEYMLVGALAIESGITNWVSGSFSFLTLAPTGSVRDLPSVPSHNDLLGIDGQGTRHLQASVPNALLVGSTILQQDYDLLIPTDNDRGSNIQFDLDGKVKFNSGINLDAFYADETLDLRTFNHSGFYSLTHSKLIPSQRIPLFFLNTSIRLQLIITMNNANKNEASFMVMTEQNNEREMFLATKSGVNGEIFNIWKRISLPTTKELSGADSNGEFLQIRDGEWKKSGKHGIYLDNLDDMYQIRNGVSYFFDNQTVQNPIPNAGNTFFNLSIYAGLEFSYRPDDITYLAYGVRGTNRNYVYMRSGTSGITFTSWEQIYPPEAYRELTGGQSLDNLASRRDLVYRIRNQDLNASQRIPHISSAAILNLQLKGNVWHASVVETNDNFLSANFTMLHDKRNNGEWDWISGGTAMLIDNVNKSYVNSSYIQQRPKITLGRLHNRAYFQLKGFSQSLIGSDMFLTTPLYSSVNTHHVSIEQKNYNLESGYLGPSIINTGNAHTFRVVYSHNEDRIMIVNASGGRTDTFNTVLEWYCRPFWSRITTKDKELLEE